MVGKLKSPQADRIVNEGLASRVQYVVFNPIFKLEMFE